MIVGDVVAVSQLHRVDTQAWSFYQADQKSLAIVHVYLDVVTFCDTLTGLAHDENPHEFASRATALRDNFLRDVAHAEQTLSSAPDAGQDPTIMVRLETVRAALPSQVDILLDLVKVEDWQAVRFRLARQVTPLMGLSSSLVADVEQEAAEERARALESVQRTRRQLYLGLPITALLILLMAVMLGWYATLRISSPLAQLDAGAKALARGEFDYEVDLGGNDELADLARAFNYAAQQLHNLYRDIKRSEAHLADSNARLEEAQRIAHVGYWEWDLITNSVTWSDETYRIYGLRPQECPMDLATVREKIHPEDWEVVSRALEEALRGSTRYTVESRVFRPTGEVRIVHSQGDVKRDTSGRAIQMFGTVQDITDRKRAEEALQENQIYLSEGQRLAHMGSWAFNPSGFFEYWSQELFKIYGLDPQRGAPTLQEYLGTIHPQDRDFMAGTIERMLAEHSGCDVTKRIVCPGGEQRYIRCVGIPVVEGEVLKGFLGTAMDVTEQELLTRELERRQAYLNEAQKLTHTGSWVFHADREELLHCSDEFFRIFGLNPQEGMPTAEQLQNRIHPEDRDRARENRRKQFREGREFVDDYRVVLPDGAVKNLHIIGHPVVDENGNFVEYVGTAMDITDRKRAQQALQRSEAYLSEAERLSHTGSWAWSPDEDIRYWSEECYRVLSFDPRDGLPRFEEFFQRIHPDDQPGFRELIQTAIREKADWEADYRIVHLDGPVSDIHVVGHPVLSTSGHLVEFVGTVVDITERRRAEQERARLRQLEADLAHINRVSVLGEMAASLAHEIKQPIAAAITSANTCLEWLAHEPPNLDRARAAAARIDKYGNRAAEIIDRIRSFYRKSPPQRELVDVNGIIHEMLTLLEGEATRSSIATRTDLSAELPKIMVDRVQLQQVFMNLLLNAIEAMKDCGGELMVKSELQNGQLQFSVSDTGVGLPTEKMDQIFSAFFTTKPQGSGMGLAISRSIVESHGGQLWASTNNGRGATFRFTLPTEAAESTHHVA